MRPVLNLTAGWQQKWEKNQGQMPSTPPPPENLSSLKPSLKSQLLILSTPSGPAEAGTTNGFGWFKWLAEGAQYLTHRTAVTFFLTIFAQAVAMLTSVVLAR